MPFLANSPIGVGAFVEPKIIPKILEVTSGLLFKKDKIALNKWAGFSDAPTCSSHPWRTQQLNTTAHSSHAIGKELKIRINYPNPIFNTFPNED